MSCLVALFRHIFGYALAVADHDMFKYTTLPTVKMFRVLELLPGENDDPIRFELHNVDWPDCPPYEAISYAWGDVTDTISVYCGHNHKPLKVTKNLHNALRHFRLKDKSRTLWADAIW